MATVGASYRFIKIPFVAQGMIIGMLGALIPTLTVWYGYAGVYHRLNGVFFANILSLVDINTMRLEAGLGTLVMGMGIGFAASLMAVTKYLKMNR
jgi:cell division transport system permease protein